MNCHYCSSSNWVQIASGKERTLRFGKGHLAGISTWTDLRPELDRNITSAFVCEGCKKMFSPGKAEQNIYFQLLHSAPEMTKGPGREIERRRGPRLPYDSWIMNFEDDTSGSGLDSSRYHFEVTYKGDDIVVTANPELLLKTKGGFSVFVPYTYRAHSWFENSRDGSFPPEGALKHGHDYSGIAIETATKIVERACRAQRDYIRGLDASENRPKPLIPKPLTMDELAEQTGVDASTVSRCGFTVRIKTPGGNSFYFNKLFPLVFAPTSGSTPERYTVEQIKHWMAEMLASKTPRPSAPKICGWFAEKGIQIATRTVAKYRADIESRARARMAIPLDFPESYGQFRANRSFNALLRNEGVSNYEMYRNLTQADFERIYEEADAEMRGVLVAFALQYGQQQPVVTPERELKAA